jgi:hypothetical protein
MFEYALDQGRGGMWLNLSRSSMVGCSDRRGSQAAVKYLGGGRHEESG